MKTTTKLLLFATSFLFFGCNPAENFANKVIQQIGDGKYVSVTYNGYSSKALDILGKYNDTFDFAEIHNEEIMENKTIDNEESYFQTDFMFDSFKLIESTESTIDLYGKDIDSRFVNKLSDSDEKKYEKIRKEDVTKNHKAYKVINDTTYTYIETENVPKFIFRYKLKRNNTSVVARMSVIKVPEKGYRVTSFFIEP